MSPLSLAKPAHPSAEEGNSNIPFSKVAPPNVPVNIASNGGVHSVHGTSSSYF